MRKIVLALALLTLPSWAHAQGWSATSSCSRNPYSSNCRVTVEPIEPPRPLTAEELAAQEAEVAKWEGYCKPTKRQDQYGVYRYHYAHEGCDVGRSSE